MIAMDVFVEPDDVNEYLRKHNLEVDSVPIVAALLQGSAVQPSGRAALLLVVELPDGRKVVAKTSFNLMTMTLSAFRGALQRFGLWDREGYP
jgi:hypothetical protein